MRAVAWRLLAVIALLTPFCRAAEDDQFKTLFQQAFELHQKGEFQAALPLWHRAYALQPNDYFVNLLIGIDLLRTGEMKASVSYLKRASRLRPKEEYPQSYLGEAFARQGLFGDAAEAYLNAVDLAPGSADSSIAWVDFALARFGDISTLLRSSTKGLAEEYRLRALAQGPGDADRASLLQRAADLDPSAPHIWSDLAHAALQRQNAPAAEQACRHALELDPNDLTAWMVDAQLAAERGNWKRAAERINMIAQRSPRFLSDESANWPKQLLPPQATVSGSAEDFFACVREAKPTCRIPAVPVKSSPRQVFFQEERWEQVTKLAPPNDNEIQPWLHRGIAFASLRDCERAIPALERGVSAPSPDLYGLFQLSRCYSQQAGRTAQQVQQSAENQSALHVMRGDIFLRLQAKPELALAEYQEALTGDKNDPSILERLAEAQFGAGKNEGARSTAEQALKVDPQRTGAKRTLARIAMQDRDYASALPYLKELAARNPHDVTGQIELAKACAQTGALDEAWRSLAPALEHGYPDEKGTLHYLLGTVLKKMGRTAEADEAFAEATKLSDAFQQKSYRDQDSDAQP